MRTFKAITPLQKHISELKRKNRTIGFVPTMGALHEGHLSLLRKSRRENNITVLSIFLNPKQFDQRSDFSSYPREEKKDIFLAKKENIDIIFYPSEQIMYPARYLTYVKVESLPNVLCGALRPGHFRGVTTIVAKLLNCVTPDKLYLGQKDYQQALILKQMISDLNWPISTRICPIVRDKDGLALSSRNIRLTQQQRVEAPNLYTALRNARKHIRETHVTPQQIRREIQTHIKNTTTAKMDYVECVNANTLKPVKNFQQQTLIAIAAYFGKTRLIDNILIRNR